MTTLIAGYARTPFVPFLRGFASTPASQLGAYAAMAALGRGGIPVEAVDALIAGQVLQAGAGQNPARQTAVAAGVSLDVPALTVNAVCLSGMEAIITGHRMIELGEAEVVVAVGQESMSLAPHLLPGSRRGTKYGAMEVVDSLELDGLTDAFEHRSMGASTDEVNGRLALTREEQDLFALSSHQRAAAARASGLLDDEIVAVSTTGRGAVVVTHDEGIRPDSSIEALAGLRPAFSPGGTITAGNSSPISDGAAAVVLISQDYATRHDVHAIARLVTHATVAGPDVSLHTQPSNAIKAALRRAGRRISELSAVEINEAFAAVGIESTKALAVDPSIVNADGGAIALGHPIGASGARIVGHLALRLARSGTGSLGAAGICGGGGQGSAVILESL